MKYIIDYIVNFFNFIGDLFVGIGRVLFKFVLIVIHAGEFLISIINSLPTIIKVIAVGMAARNAPYLLYTLYAMVACFFLYLIFRFISRL